LKFFCFIVSLLLIFSCKKDVGKINYGDFPADVGKIIANNCATAGCHNNASYLSSAGLNLTSWVSMFGGSSSGSPVIPYSSKFSSLCYFINTYSELGIQNVPTMPLNKKALSKDDVKLIYNWIDAGAPDVNGNVMWADNPQRKKLYVANQGCDIVTVIDAETQLPMRYISVGNKGSIESPHQIRVSPDGQYWYVNFINNNILQKYRCSDDSYVGDIPLTPLAAGTGTDDAFYWNTFNISNDSKKAYCVSFNQNGVVCAVDLVNRKLIHYLGGLTNPHGILLSKDNTSLYVTAQYGNYITEFDTAFTTYSKYSLTNDPPLDNTNPLNLHDIIQSPNANEIVITCQFTNELRVFNTLTHSVTAVVPTGLNPQEVLYSPSSNSYFISCMDDSLLFPRSYGVITKINASNFAVKNVACGYQPHGIGLDENKKLLYVLSRNVTDAGPSPHHTSVCGGRNGFMNFIDLNSFTLLNKKYELSVDPYFIAPRP
jgi:YVTN family beta-propeller protein